MFSISFRKCCDAKKKIKLLTFDYQNVNSLYSRDPLSTACARSVFLPSCRNMVLNQSACIFALGYFLNAKTINNGNLTEWSAI